jgi:hypothetical protein
MQAKQRKTLETLLKPIQLIIKYVHLPGQLGTRLTAYHIYGMWLVLSNA